MGKKTPWKNLIKVLTYGTGELYVNAALLQGSSVRCFGALTFQIKRRRASKLSSIAFCSNYNIWIDPHY